MIKNDNIKISTIIPKKVYDMLLDEAEYEDRSISGMVRKIIKDHYNIKDEE